MRLANYRVDGVTKAGFVVGSEVVDFSGAEGELGEVGSVDEILAKGLLAEAQKAGVRPTTARRPLSSVELLPPVLTPEKILLVAVNYRAHGTELKTAPPPEPYFFTKFRSCLVGPSQPIMAPVISKRVDWEAELAVIIGRRGKYIRADDAYDYVAGYTVANDVSFRDLQFPPGWPEKLNSLGQNWLKGKALDGALPLGPSMVTGDEIPDPQNLSISLSVNGIKRQDSSTSKMIFGVAHLIEYISSGITLAPGDIISTGTPEGVAAFSGAPYLKDGDVVEASVEGIGTLRNTVKAEGA